MDTEPLQSDRPAMSLEGRALIAGGLVILAVIGIFLHLDSRRARERTIDEKLEALVGGLDLAITNHEGAVRGLEALIEVTPDLDADTFDRYGDAILDDGEYPATWALIWAEGEGLDSVAIRFIVSDVADQSSAIGFVLSDDPERLEAIRSTAATGEPAFSRPTYVEDTDDWIISIYQAVVDEDGGFRGVVVATLDLDLFLTDLVPELRYQVVDLGLGGLGEPVELHRNGGGATTGPVLATPGDEFPEGARVDRMGRVWEVRLGADEVPGPISARDLALVAAGLCSTAAAARLLATREAAAHRAQRRAESLADDLRTALAEEEKWRSRLGYAMRNADIEIWEREVGGESGWSSGDWAEDAPSMYEEFLRRLHPDDHHFVDRPELDGPGEVMETEFRFADDDGVYRWKLSRAAVIERGGRRLLVGAQMDIDHQRTALEDLNRVNHLLKESNEGLLEFTRVASHDMRSPLRNIQTLCEFIDEDHAGDLPPDIQHHLDRIDGQAARLMLLLDDLLDYSSARTKVEARETAIDQVVENLVADLAPAEGPAVEVTCRFDGVGELQSMPFATVVRNLVDNAIKYHDHPASGMVTVNVDRIDDLLIVDVSDDGPGIDPAYHDKIFEPFQRLRTHGPVDGSGVGLSVVRRMAETYGATIDLESTPGIGTTFTVRWPLGPDQVADAEIGEGAQLEAPEPGETRNDNAGVRFANP